MWHGLSLFKPFLIRKVFTLGAYRASWGGNPYNSRYYSMWGYIILLQHIRKIELNLNVVFILFLMLQENLKTVLKKSGESGHPFLVVSAINCNGWNYSPVCKILTLACIYNLYFIKMCSSVTSFYDEVCQRAIWFLSLSPFIWLITFASLLVFNHLCKPEMKATC